MRKRGSMKAAVAAWAVLAALLLVGGPVFAGGGREGRGAREGRIKIVYVCKMLTHPWFQEEDKGAREMAAKLGVDYIGIDANLDDEAFMQGIESAIAQGASGIMICITDQAMGPTVTDRVRGAGLPLVTINDNILDSDGKAVPHVGIDTYEEVVRLGSEYGIVKKAGAWYSYDGKQIGQGSPKAAAYLREHPDEFKVVKEALYAELFG